MSHAINILMAQERYYYGKLVLKKARQLRLLRSYIGVGGEVNGKQERSFHQLRQVMDLQSAHLFNSVCSRNV